MAKVNLKSIYTSADKFTILQLLEEFVKKVDAIDFPSDEEMVQAQHDISVLQGKVETIEDTTIPGLADRVTTIEDTTIPGITQRLTTDEGKIETLEITTIPALGNRLTTVEGKVDTLENTTIPALAGRVTNLETTVITKIYQHRITLASGSYRTSAIVYSSTSTPYNNFSNLYYVMAQFSGKLIYHNGNLYMLLGTLNQSEDKPEATLVSNPYDTIEELSGITVTDNVTQIN